jgi:hypothetical protein
MTRHPEGSERGEGSRRTCISVICRSRGRIPVYDRTSLVYAPDPAIRLRDLADAPAETVPADRARAAIDG